ncbi:MAG: hypothetical protein BAJALOKI3v1_1180005, partial [Promethearchaeota archaeon]
MKKSHYCFLLLLIIISPLVVYLISVDLPKTYNNLKLAIPYDARDYIGLYNSGLTEGYTGYGINAAVIDTGIDDNHDVFTEAGVDRITYYDVVNNQTNPEDSDGHGTWVASILGGNSTEYKGV